MQWVLEALSLRVKRPGREANHSPQSSAEVKESVELYLHFPNTPSWRDASLSTGTTLPLPLSRYIYIYREVPNYAIVDIFLK
jgi:hypothetical protein